MKRMINGAVSDISHALKQQHQQLAAAQGSHELPSPSIDYIFLPTGSGILVPQTELMKINSGSLQVRRIQYFAYFALYIFKILVSFLWDNTLFASKAKINAF